MTTPRSTDFWSIVYADNKNKYLRVRDLSCEGYRDRSTLCGPRDDPSIFTSCGRNIDKDSDSVVISDDEIRYCNRIAPELSENNKATFDRLRDVINGNSVVLISDSVGVHESDWTRIGYHDTKKLWKWILDNIDNFISAGIEVLAMEFVKVKPDFLPYVPDQLTNKTIVSSSSTNVDQTDLETLVSINKRMPIIGLDDNGYAPEHILKNIENVHKKIEPQRKMGVIIGSGYSKDICLNPDRFSFPTIHFEIFNIKRDLEPSNDLHFVRFYCDDYDR